MKRWLIAGAAVLAALVGWGSPVAQADVNNFRISNFEAEYTLRRDDEGRSVLRVIERITADFPDFDQNKGLVREIPSVYDGHSVSFHLESLQRGGLPEPVYAQYARSNHQVVETGTDEFVRGQQVYEFTYTLRDVMRHFADTGRDELYWDINGTGWRVPIDSLSAKVHLTGDLAVATTGHTACYQGAMGSTDRCEIMEIDGGYSVSVSNLAPYENATLAIGFEPGTFAAYEPSLLERFVAIWVIVAAITGAIGIALMVWLGMRWRAWMYRDREVAPIAPEYLPPPDTSVAAAATVLPNHHSTIAAELIDLAVRHYIQIVETRPKSFWRTAEYDIVTIRDLSDLRAEEQELLRDMFPSSPQIGSRLALKTLRHNTAVGMQMLDNPKKLQELTRGTYGLFAKDEAKTKWFYRVGKIILGVAILTLSPLLFIAAITAFICGATLWRLTDKGLALRRYLEGLKLYIRVAETDRLQMLQSPDGVAKVPVGDPASPAQLVKLYEKVLPYAIVFHKEKEWNKRLGEYYQTTGTQPDWYAGGSGTFNAVAFGAMMSSFSGSVSQTSAASSSSGGSGGGGSSGGGGGGGGGGGR